MTWDGHLEGQEKAVQRPPLLLGPDQPFLAAEMAAAINASTLALLDANIPMRATVVAVSCAVVHEKDMDQSRAPVESNRDSYIVVDPTPEEELAAQSVHIFAFSMSGYDPTAKDAKGMKAELVYAYSRGRTNKHLRTRLMEVAQSSMGSILESIRDLVERRYE